MKIFENVAQLKLARLATSQIVKTKGYYTANDGGGAEYIIVATGTGTADGYVDHTLSNGNFAILIKPIAISIEQAGGSSDNIVDNTPVLESIDAVGVEYCYLKSTGTYLFNSTPALTQVTSIVSSNSTLSGATPSEINSSVIKRDYKLKVKYPPALEANHLLPIDIFFKGGRYFTDFDPRSLKPIRAQFRYVDPIKGNDVNNGDIGDPYKSLSRALTTAQAVDIEIILKSGKYYYKDSAAGNNTNAKGVSIVCPDGVATLTNGAYPRIWREDPANLNVWVADTVALGEDLFAEKSNIRFLDMSGRASDTAKGYQILEASVANINGGAVGWVTGGVTTRIRMPYNRNPNDDLEISYAVTNLDLRINDVTTQTIYVENVDTMYGRPNSARFDTSTADSKIILINCNFHNGHIDDSLELNGNGLSVLYRCSATGGYKDGFNYQVNSPVSGSVKHDLLEIECTSTRNGIELTGSNNGSTIHGFCNIIRLNCDHSNNQNKNVHDVGTSRSFNVGVRAEGSETFAAGFQSGLVAGEPSQMWLVGCKSDITIVEDNATISRSYDTVESVLTNDGGTLLHYDL